MILTPGQAKHAHLLYQLQRLRNTIRHANPYALLYTPYPRVLQRYRPPLALPIVKECLKATEDEKTLFPSISKYFGFFFRLSSARCMALKDAFKIFMESISSLSTTPTAKAMAFFSITFLSLYLFSSATCFESFSKR